MEPEVQREITAEVRRVTGEQTAVARNAWIGRVVIAVTVLAFTGLVGFLFNWGGHSVVVEAHGKQIDKHETRIGSLEIGQAEHRILLKDFTEIKKMVIAIHRRK